MDAINLAISQSFTPALMAPFVSPPLCNNISNGQFVREINDVRRRLSIFRIYPKNIGIRWELRHRNQVYMAMVMVAGTAQMPAVNMLVANDELDLPNSSKQFRGYVEGYYVLCIGILGNQNWALANYNDNVVLQQSEMIAMIKQMYPDMAHCWLAWAVIMMYIYRMMNDYFKWLLLVELPMVTGTPAVWALMMPPDLKTSNMT